MSNPEDSKLFSRYALALFVIGLIGYLPLSTFVPLEVASGFLVIAEVLALVLGLLSWRHTPGKVAVVGVLVAALWAGATFIMFTRASHRSRSGLEGLPHDGR